MWQPGARSDRTRCKRDQVYYKIFHSFPDGRQFMLQAGARSDRTGCKRDQVYFKVFHSFPDCRQVIKDASAYKLPDEVHASRRSNLHRDLQGLRQTHEPHTRRLRRIQESQTQEGEGRTRREASFRLGSIHTCSLFGVNNSLNKATKVLVTCLSNGIKQI